MSQKLLPGVDEIIPFFGWSLFSKVPNEDSKYSVLIHAHGSHALEPPATFLRAPDTIVIGNRYIGRKVVQRLGQALDRGDEDEARVVRRLLEQNHLAGRIRYELIFERYHPLEKWRTGAGIERSSVAFFDRSVPP